MGKFKVVPSNEIQTREWFAAHLNEFEYDVIESDSAFPDYVLRDKDGNLIRAEVESISSNFVAHQHDPGGCDLVVCWSHTGDVPLPVLELSSGKLYAANEKVSVSRKHESKLVKSRKGKTRKWRIKEALESCPEEVGMFMSAMEEDLRIHCQWLDMMHEPRLNLLRAQCKLEEALRKSGGKLILAAWGNLHPYDFYCRAFGRGDCNL